MALSVAKPTAQPKITVGVPFKLPTGSLQGSNVNPQPAYNPQPTTYNPQPSTYNPQPTYNPQQAAQVAAAAEAARQQAAAAAAAEIARQQELRRVQVQTQISDNTAKNKEATLLKVQNPAWAGNVILGKKVKLPKIVLPQQSEYDKAYAAAYWHAMSDVNGKTKTGKQNFAQKILDKVSMGSDRRASSAREYAAGQAQKVVDQTTKTYQGNLDTFLKAQASKKAAVEGAKYLTQAQFDKAVAAYTAWESGEIGKLENQRAAANAQIDAYGKASSAPLTSLAAKGASMFNRNVIHGVPSKILGGVWDYTLGQGSRDIPSLATLPGRIVNTIGNLNTQNRTIYREDGSSTNRLGSADNAWQASFNQRQSNLKPWVDKPFDKATAVKMFGEKAKKEAAQYKAAGLKDPALTTYDGQLKRYWNGYNVEHRWNNTVLDNAADPLILLGALGKIGKAAKLGEKLTTAAKSTKFGSFLAKTSDKVASNKVISWLGAEHKTPEQHLSDAIDEARKTQASAQNILPRVNALNKLIAAAGGRELDLSGLHALKNLTDSEIPIFKRMVGGKLSARDRVMLSAPGMAPVRAKLEDISSQWQKFAEQMRLADNVNSTRFSLGKKNYLPDTSWIDRTAKHPLDQYNFRKFKKGTGPSRADQVYQSAVDRYFKSSIDHGFSASEMTRSANLKASRDVLLKRYDKMVQPARDNVQAAYDKTQTPFNKFRRATRNVSPLGIWKKSVLKYRPAWYVNNELYNTQAVGLSAGFGGLAEKAKMLSPRYYKKVMDGMPEIAKSNISKEVGNDKLSRLAIRQENWSRAAAYSALKKQGLSDAEAAKRVNRYLLDYKTHNWERPFKAIVPFWNFQKGVAKAAAVMPFDRPVAAKAYSGIDRTQQQQYNNDFNSMIPKLKQLGYSDAEIEKFRQDNAKYYAGKLKLGGKYFNTPFNAFSDKQMSQLGFNPFLAAAGETADSVDSFGSPVKGQDGAWWRRLASKFPQVDLGIQAKKALDVQSGKVKPTSSWIANPGDDGFGMTKQKQGSDPSKPNYSRSMDPRAKLGQNALAFAGVPRSMAFDKAQFIQSKTLQKATSSYFATDWKKLEQAKGYTEMTKQQNALFKKYGMTADDFYKGILSKYDTAGTTRIKGMKATAAKANKSLFDEYAAQPKGTRNAWATQKLRTLVDQGYFDKNPFLKSFDWINPASVAKADKQNLAQQAIKSGDWSAYEKIYGKTAKAQARDYAVKTGDWSKYKAQYGVTKKASPFQYNGQYFKTAASMAKYKEGEFWHKYALADRVGKKQLLADNPRYNTRANWTAAMWTSQKTADKAKLKADLSKLAGFSVKVDANTAAAKTKSTIFLGSVGGRYSKKIKWA